MSVHACLSTLYSGMQGSYAQMVQVHASIIKATYCYCLNFVPVVCGDDNDDDNDSWPLVLQMIITGIEIFQ